MFYHNKPDGHGSYYTASDIAAAYKRLTTTSSTTSSTSNADTNASDSYAITEDSNGFGFGSSSAESNSSTSNSSIMQMEVRGSHHIWQFGRKVL